jgi:hypothetical protein
MELVMNLLRTLSTDQNIFIRSSCFTLWAALLEFWLPAGSGLDMLIQQATSCLLTDQEAIVRRGAVDLLTKLASRQLPAAVLQVEVSSYTVVYITPKSKCSFSKIVY